MPIACEMFGNMKLMKLFPFLEVKIGCFIGSKVKWNLLESETCLSENSLFSSLPHVGKLKSHMWIIYESKYNCFLTFQSYSCFGESFYTWKISSLSQFHDVKQDNCGDYVICVKYHTFFISLILYLVLVSHIISCILGRMTFVKIQHSVRSSTRCVPKLEWILWPLIRVFGLSYWG